MEEGSVESPVFLKMFLDFLKNIEQTSNQKWMFQKIVVPATQQKACISEDQGI